jgi:NADPH:quinone reductase-like Zn-dependent oxidoreductase
MVASQRPRPVEEKAPVCVDAENHVWPPMRKDAVRPVIHSTLPLPQAAAAHRMLEASNHIGTIVLTT